MELCSICECSIERGEEVVYFPLGQRNDLVMPICDACEDADFAYDRLAEDDSHGDYRFESETYDDGQPSEYDEWQDYYGGDDGWDHGDSDVF